VLLIVIKGAFSKNAEKTYNCSLQIKNVSNEKQIVKLFDKKYWQDTHDKGVVEINTFSNYIDNIAYYNVIESVENKRRFTKNIKLFLGDKNKDSKYKFNSYEHDDIIKYIFPSQIKSETVDVCFNSKHLVVNFEIEVEPQSEILIMFK
jgi:hypothetical protein